MKKGLRIISLALSLILISGFVALSYGADFELVTGAAFGYSPAGGIKAGASDIKAAAAAPDGSSSSPFYIEPKSASATRYYVNDSGNVATASTTISHFADIVSQITNSIAYTGYYLGTRLTSINQKTGNIESDVDDIRRYLNVDYYQIMTDIQSKLATIISHSGLGPFVPYFMPDPDSYNYTANAWKNVSRRTVDDQGNSTLGTYTNDSMVLQIRELLRTQNNSNALIYQLGFNSVLGTDYENALYNQWFNLSTGNTYTQSATSLWADVRFVNRILTALTSRTTGIVTGSSFKITDYSNTESTVTPTSLYDYLRLLGENMSKSLGRLAFVLANDEDIALRQQTQDQQNAYKTTFTSSGANARMSTSDIGTAGDSVSELKSAFTSSASARDAFNGFSAGTDGRWDWFSTEILNSLDTTTNNRKSNSNLTNFLDDYYNEVLDYVD